MTAAMEGDGVEADEYLENLPAKLMQTIRCELGKDEAWLKVAEYLASKNFISDESLQVIKSNVSPARELLNILIYQRFLTVEVFQRILEGCQLYDVLRIIDTCDPAKILIPTEDSTSLVPLGAKVSIAVAVSGSPFPEMLWCCDGEPLVGETSPDLVLSKFSNKDVGEYTCKVKQRLNGKPSELTSHKYILRAKDQAPRIAEDLTQHVQVEAQEDLTLSFKVTGYPEPKCFRWYKSYSNKPISECDLPQLVIRGADVHNSGEYYCIALNEAGSCTTRHAIVKVKESSIGPQKPQIIEQPRVSPDYYAGDWMYLACLVICRDTVNFTCFLNNEELKGNSNAHLTTSSSENYHHCELKYRLTQENMEKENWKRLNFKFAVFSSAGRVLSDDVLVEVKTRHVKQTHTARNKWALVIGNSKYQQMGQLPASGNDIVTMKDMFIELGFMVMMLSDLKRDAIQNAVILFSTFVQKGDYVSFFYAGHGIHRCGKDYIIPLDASLYFRMREQNVSVKESDVSLDECISYVQITNVLQRNEPALIFSVYDTCRGIKPKFEGWRPHPSQDIYQTASKNSFFIYATSENYEAYEAIGVDRSLLVTTLQSLMTHRVSVQDLSMSVLRKFHFPGEWDQRQVPKISGDLALPLSLADPSRPQPMDELECGVLKEWERLASGRGRMEDCITVGDAKVEASVYWNIEPQKGGVTWVITNCLHLTVNLSCDAQVVDVQIRLSTGEEESLRLRGSVSKQFLIPHLEDLEECVLVALCITHKGIQYKKGMYLERPAFSHMFLKGNHI